MSTPKKQEDFPNISQAILDKHIESCASRARDELSGAFLYGAFTGIVLSYSGILGFGVGVTAGMFINSKRFGVTSIVINAVMERCQISWLLFKKTL